MPPANQSRIVCYFDGGCPGNQLEEKGPMKAAYVVADEKLVRDVRDLETPDGLLRSNNIAEYRALIFLLTRLKGKERGRGVRGQYLICGDSQLVIRQMRGEYRVTKPHLRRLYVEATRLASELDIQFRWVRRDDNPAGFLLDPRKRRDKEATRGLLKKS
jgi:ribonuclease HI